MKVTDLVLTGIGTPTSVLRVPLQNVETDFLAGYRNTQAPRVANSNEDVAENLNTWEMAGTFENGAFVKRFEIGTGRYYRPSPSGTGDTWTDDTVFPLAWTLRRDEPLMCGAGHSDESGNYAFKKIVLWESALYAIDVKNNLVWRFNAGVWQHYIGAGTGWTTSLFNGSITSTADAGGLVEVTTSASHGLTTNDRVQIKDVVTGTEANSTTSNPTWAVTVTAANKFTLQTSVYAANGTGGTWKATVEALNGTYPTDILARTTELLIGTDSGVARKTSSGGSAGTTYSNFTNAAGTAVDAAHFCDVGTSEVGYVVWYSRTSTGITHQIVERRSNGRNYKVGDDAYPVEAMEWFKNGIFVTKKDGAYFYNPSTRVAQTVLKSLSKQELDGRTLELHDNKVWFNMDGYFWSWDGSSKPRESFATFEGTGNRPFYYGNIVGAHSDGQQLYAMLRVKTEEGTNRYQYWLCVNTGNRAWHPILLVNTTRAPSSGLVGHFPGAICYYDFKLHYSAGNQQANSGRAHTGYLCTDGISPMCDASNGVYFTRNVAIELGWFDGGKRALKKFYKEVRETHGDAAGTSGTGKVKFYYKKFEGSSWEAIGESSAGTKDNRTIAIPAESGVSVLGVTDRNLINFKIELTNTDSTPENAWWLEKMYVLGRPHYDPVYAGIFEAWLPMNLDDASDEQAGGYNAVTIRTGLLDAIAQAEPIKLTHPIDGTEYYVKLMGTADGERMVTVTAEAQESDIPTRHSVERKLRLEFIQMN